MERLLDLAALQAFARVVETGSFARAAERLSSSKSIVSRRVAALEEQLGAKLLTRTARGARPTDAGAAYYTRAMAALSELEAAGEDAALSTSVLAGPVRVTAPLSFGVLRVAPLLAEFAAQNPRVELDVHFDDRAVDVVGDGFDLAIRIGTLRDSSLIARRLAAMRRVLVASPGYLAQHGTPEEPGDLARHALLTYANMTPAEELRFQVDGTWLQPRARVRLRANNGDMLCAAAIAGIGLAMLPQFIAGPALTAGRLVEVLAQYPLQDSAMHLVLPPGRASTARLRALVDFLVQRLGPEPACPAAEPPKNSAQAEPPKKNSVAAEPPESSAQVAPPKNKPKAAPKGTA